MSDAPTSGHAQPWITIKPSNKAAVFLGGLLLVAFMAGVLVGQQCRYRYSIVSSSSSQVPGIAFILDQKTGQAEFVHNTERQPVTRVEPNNSE